MYSVPFGPTWLTRRPPGSNTVFELKVYSGPRSTRAGLVAPSAVDQMRVSPEVSVVATRSPRGEYARPQHWAGNRPRTRGGRAPSRGCSPTVRKGWPPAQTTAFVPAGSASPGKTSRRVVTTFGSPSGSFRVWTSWSFCPALLPIVSV